MPELIYLAAPLSHNDPLVEHQRFCTVTIVAAALVVSTACEVFSPITHSHPINQQATAYAKRLSLDWSPTHDFWLNFDNHMLDIADWLYILTLDGWRRSFGIKREMDRFLKRRPMRYVKKIRAEDYCLPSTSLKK